MRTNKLLSFCPLFLLMFYGIQIFCQKTSPGFQINTPSYVDSTFVLKKVVPSLATWGLNYNNIDLTSIYSPFNVLVNLRSLGSYKNIMDNEVHDQIKALAEYSEKKGISIVPDLDVRMALPTFEAKYSDELQQMLVVREFKPEESDSIDVVIHSRLLQDHYFNPYITRSGSFIKAYSYILTPEGTIDPLSLVDISKTCTVTAATKDLVDIIVPTKELSISSNIIVTVAFTYLYPDVFAPHIMDFQEEIIRKYADVPLAGAHKDEWGFPPALFGESTYNEFWFTKYRSDAYSKRTGGRDLLNDILLMYKGIKGKENERLLAINHFREMSWQQNGALEDDFYHTVKEIFGPEAIVAVHPTWFPFPERREYKKNGLDWWVVRRDWAQTDEITPFSIRTALAKKWRSPVWYNMFYRFGLPQGSINAEDYVTELWCSALAGGRVNNLPSKLGVKGILGSDYVRAETRIRLLNFIDPVPLDCPVAVVFGHASTMNWAGPYFEDTGMKLVDRLWSMGIPTDLIPTSEIENKNLIIDNNGWIKYGDQRYAAVVLYNPEFEKLSTSIFFNEASKGKTRLFKIGNWLKDFNGKTFNGNATLPKSMAIASSIESVVLEIPKILKKRKIDLQTPASRIMEGFGHTSQTPPTTGFCHLIDGTLIQVAGTNDASGDIIKSEKKIGKHVVIFDAVGVAAVRLNGKGRVQALAAGGLKYFKTGDFIIQLNERIDLAFWTNNNGELEGIIQGWDGEIPSNLLAITKKWVRIGLPVPYQEIEKDTLKKAFIDAEEHYLEKTMLIPYEKLTDIDGNNYLAVKIGDQTWMSENLRASRYKDGTRIFEPRDNNALWDSNSTGAYTWYNNDSAAYENQYGKLYNWNAVKTGKVCPEGWHVSSAEDWTFLIDYMNEQMSTVGYQKISGLPPGKTVAAGKSDNNGFIPQAAGYRDHFGGFMSIGRFGIWWSSSGTDKRAVWNSAKKYLYLANGELNVHQGLSVRCIKDEIK